MQRRLQQRVPSQSARRCLLPSQCLSNDKGIGSHSIDLMQHAFSDTSPWGFSSAALSSADACQHQECCCVCSITSGSVVPQGLPSAIVGNAAVCSWQIHSSSTHSCTSCTLLSCADC